MSVFKNLNLAHHDPNSGGRRVESTRDFTSYSIIQGKVICTQAHYASKHQAFELELRFCAGGFVVTTDGVNLNIRAGCDDERARLAEAFEWAAKQLRAGA